MKRYVTAFRFLAATALLLIIGRASVVVQAQVKPDNRLVDIGFVVDVSGSFSDDIAKFKLEATAIVSDITTSFPNALFALATFQDYPLKGFGSATDVPHARVSDLVPGNAAFLAAVNRLSAAGGGDFPESQLESLYQCLTGAGRVVPASLDGGYVIPSGLNFNFRPGSARILILWTDAIFHDPTSTRDYPGPTMATVVQAALTGGRAGIVPRRDRHRWLQAEKPGPDAVRVVGIASTNASTVLAEMTEIATATGAVAGPGGLDCDGNGTIDVPEGSAIICPAAGGLTAAIESIIEVIAPTIPIPISARPSTAPSTAPSLRPIAATRTPDDGDNDICGGSRGGGLSAIFKCLWPYILNYFQRVVS